MSSSKQRDNAHLLWRAAFGPSSGQISYIGNRSHNQIWSELLKSSEKEPLQYNIVDNYLPDAMPNNAAIMNNKKQGVADKKIAREKNRQSIANLNLLWLNDMVKSEAQLREKMALFWHGHFACRSLSALYQQQLLNTIRSNAMGNFKDLLFAVSRSAAMLHFLNNNQNRKNHPNENFAREVMELFTLGRGNYTERDIKEAARAFTGWGTNIKGDFIFRQKQHDEGIKTFLGKTGNFNGDDMLNILLEQPQTAWFITEKIYRFFVNDTVDRTVVQKLSASFYTNGYDITRLLKEIFLSDWFYEEKNIGVKIKSPVELLAGIQRILPIEFENKNFLLLLQRLLGQLLLYPPNVAGWPGGKSWIDSSTLMVRMRLPKLLSEADQLTIIPKDDDDQMMGMMDAELKPVANKAKKKNNALGKGVKTTIDWSNYLLHFSKEKKEDLITAIVQILLQTNGNISQEMIKQYSAIDSREQFIKTATIQVMSLPEYQLC